jgi:predicted enzyme related to lactoylglutathione lyase
MRDVLNWFGIPVNDIKRAAVFCGATFRTTLEIVSGPGFASAMFPHDVGVGGGLVAGDGYLPPAVLWRSLE